MFIYPLLQKHLIDDSRSWPEQVLSCYLGGLGGVNIKSSADCSLRLDFPVSGCSIVVRYLGSWYAGEPQKETIVRIEKPGLCSFGRPYSFGGCGALKRRSRVTFEFFVGLFVVN